MLKQRIITALIMVTILGICLTFLSPQAFAVFLSVLVLAAAWEWTRLCGWSDIKAQAAFIAVIFACLGLAYYCILPMNIEGELRPLLWVLAISVLGWLWMFRWVYLYQKARLQLPKNPLIKTVLGVFLLIPTWLVLCDLYFLGVETLTPLFLMIWGADIGAYFSGRRWGKTKLASRVSPGKSWEGVIGGVIFSLLLVLIYSVWRGENLGSTWGLAFWAILCVVTVAFSIVGDLLESLFKRNAGMKDSSQLLPGHGGILDRIDSLTAASPVFLLSLYSLMLLGN